MATPGPSREPEERGTPQPLSGGRHSIDPEVVSHNQRERLLGGLVSSAAKHGYNATTVAQIAEDASVSMRTFYEHFADKEACFRAAYEALDAYIATLIAAAVENEAQWPEQAAAAFATLIGFLSEHPNFARIYLVECLVVGDGLAEAREQTTDRFISLLKPGRQSSHFEAEVAVGVEEGLIGGIFTLLARQVLTGRAAELDRFVPAVVEFALAPYTSAERARAIGARYA